MEDNPDLAGCTTDQWERHLKHHMKIQQTKEQEAKEETDAARLELLKLQLEEARNRVGDTKNKSEYQMVQQTLHQAKRGPGELGRRHRTGWRRSWDKCHGCGELGHWKRMCPKVQWRGIPNIPNQYRRGYGYATQQAYLLPQPSPHHGSGCQNLGVGMPWGASTPWGPLTPWGIGRIH